MTPPDLPRRLWLGLLPLALLGGCGFKLRETPPMPFSRILLSGFAPRSPMEAELRDRLAASVQVVDQPGQADVVLLALADRRERSVVASTTAGQVRELQLRVNFEFRVATPGGRELMPASSLGLARDMSYREAAALGKAQEENELFAAMQTDIVSQVLARLARVGERGAAAAGPRNAAAPAPPAAAAASR